MLYLIKYLLRNIWDKTCEINSWLTIQAEPVPLIEGLESDLVRHSICLLQKQDDPWSPVRPLFCHVDPWRQPVPVEDDMIGPQ